MTVSQNTATPGIEEPPASMQDLPVVETILNLAISDPALAERQRMVVLASLESSEAITAELDSNTSAMAGSSSTPPPAEEAPAKVKAAGAFLSSITVSGFRGIGDKAQLKLHPGPGLTVVAGRNGSGKSSFAEALEYALTGDSYRWSDRPASWKNSWRNLHQTQAAALRIELAEEGTGRTEIGVDWIADSVLDDRKVWTQRRGAQRTPGIESLGWDTALELYRPFLSYDELGQRLDGPQTELYRSIESILGLEQIADGIERLASAVKRLKVPLDLATAARTELRKLLEPSADSRAQQVFAEIRKQKPNLDLIGRIATGVSAPDELGSQLRTLGELTVPNQDAAERPAQDLLEAVETLATAGDTASARASARSNLLEMALGLHGDHGDQSCPVCEVGVLDTSWRERATVQVATEQAELAAVRAAHQELADKRRAARVLVGVPALPSFTGELQLSSIADADAALKAWSETPESDVELAQHLTSRVASTAAALTQLRDEAVSRMSERDDSWQGMAQRIAAWVELKRSADTVDVDLRDVKSASAWLKDNAVQLRNKGLEPLADEARGIWAKLRQESSIDLDTITLSGQRNRGKVNLTATVDGVATEALPVMSQGELNAIALALFLPRATMSASPLQFVVLDDPVQAMDLAKVDGLTEVLIQYAKERQVIVFTHDDRLAESVRRTAPLARIVQVERGVGSKVEVVECQSPARRYLKDAWELLQDKKLPEEVLRKALPGYARLAMEAAGHEVFFRRRLTAGIDRHQVEAAWTSALTSQQKITLALRDSKDADLSKWRRIPHRQRVLKLCGHDAHHSMIGTPVAALEDLGRSVEDLLMERS